MEIFVELSILITIAAFTALVAKHLRQPLIVGYIIAGIISGPYFLNIIQSEHTIEVFSKLGITVLLFIVGLHLKPQTVREVGKVALATGIGQILFTSLIGFFIAIALGFSTTVSIYIAIALTFSSTIIILKLLTDKGDVHKLYGKISIGFLLVQDIAATLILIIISSINNSAGNITLSLTTALTKGIIVAVILYFGSKYLLPKLYNIFAQSQELLFISSIAWGMLLASGFYALDFSIEIGALVAGIALSATPFSYEIGARLRPLRDFFITIFFILLGSQMALSNLGSLLVPAVVFSAFVLIGNPLIVIIIMNLLGYNKRIGFLCGLTVAQISEFSLILIAFGFENGSVDQSIVSLITLVGLITIAGSTYLIMYSNKIYSKIAPLLTFFEIRKINEKLRTKETATNHRIILFGYHRVGYQVATELKKLPQEVSSRRV
jgi:Kef-type K+ transport system membrane component KefB